MQNTKIDPKKVAAIFHVLGNVYRLKIVKILLAGEKNVSDINTLVTLSQPALSQHLAKLRKHGIIGARREQRKIFYFIKNPFILTVVGAGEQAVSN